MFISEIFILFIAGLGAGIVTGLMGASAVVIAAPLMIVFLKYDAFTAIGISLAIDVIASAITAYVFYKHKNIDIKPSILILIFAVIGAFLGSYFSSSFPHGLLSICIGIFVMLTGVNFMKNGVMGEVKYIKEKTILYGKKFKWGILSLSGFIVGLIGGIFGAGGGITLLLILTMVMGYRTHVAIGTSVFIMAFLALSGTIGHMAFDKFMIYPFIIAAIGGALGAYFTSYRTNATSEERLNKILGFVFFVLGLFLAIQQIIIWIY